MNFEIELFFSLLFLIKKKLTFILGTCNFEQIDIFRNFVFLELFVMLLHFRLCKYTFFRLIRKPHIQFSVKYLRRSALLRAL